MDKSICYLLPEHEYFIFIEKICFFLLKKFEIENFENLDHDHKRVTQLCVKTFVSSKNLNFFLLLFLIFEGFLAKNGTFFNFIFRCRELLRELF